MTHVLLPVLVLVRRADVAVVIGAALAAKAGGVGYRRIAAGLGRAAETVRGWLRCFGGRVEAVRAVFTWWCPALAPDPVLPGQLAVSQGKPRVGIDHAAAAAVWAQQANSPIARAYAADVAVRAYVADNQPDRCRESLDQEYAALQADTDEPRAPWWYFFNESFYWHTAAKYALKLQRPDEALSIMDKSLTLVDPANLQGRIFRLLFRAEVRIQ